ncbi:hypothetical protein B5807_07722 [Epicoccum nigrum]|uniref:Uncharacterized protein n=1 Tax=Epicoccum nigrum TaxID=105696 RepID=A0A1Y2LWG9_EPING|nr:hypothetical protein B5807_07722 [Epicoccum nigrum]
MASSETLGCARCSGCCRNNAYLEAGSSAQIPQALKIDAGTVVELPTLATSIMPIPGGNETLGLEGGTAAQPDFGMISAIYNGFRNDISWNSDEQIVNNVCITGNCTWPAYTTSAVCSVCNDLSDQVKLEKGMGTGGANVPSPSNMKMEGPYTAFILPNVNLSNANGAKNRPLQGRRSGQEATLLTANTTFDPLETISFQDLSTMIVSFKVMRASEEWMQGKVAWNASKPIATECALHFCANQYRAESQNGQIRETRLNSWVIRDPQSYQANPNASTVEPGPEVDAWVASKGNTLYDRYVPRYDLRLSTPLDQNDESNPQSFNISYAYIRTLSEYLEDLSTAPKNIKLMAYPTWDGSMTPLVDVLWESQNLTQTFDHIAVSLTNQVRNTASNASHIGHAPGTTQKWEIHVRVRWAYLAFPASMIAIGIFYVLLTIIESTRLHMPVWKESALPSLVHGLDDETQSLLRADRSQTAGPKAHETIVKFGRDEKSDCLRLIAQQDAVR